MTLYTIKVNGLPICEPVAQQCKDYVLKRLELFPELKVEVTPVEEGKEYESSVAG
jgi:hypothetical protein